MKHLLETNTHQDKLFEHFSGRVKFHGEKFGKTLVVMLFTNRSGSNLLGDYLVNSGNFSGFEEVLNWDFAIRAAQASNIQSFNNLLKGYYAHKTKEGQTFGVKASIGQLAMLVKWGYLDAFDEVRVIHIERDDIVSQAVSFSIASQTGSWISGMTPKAEPVFRYDEILGFLERIVQENAQGRIGVKALDLPVMRASYEDLVANPAAVVQRVHDWFGFPFDASTVQTSMTKQASGTNEEFATLFREKFLKSLRS